MPGRARVPPKHGILSTPSGGVIIMATAAEDKPRLEPPFSLDNSITKFDAIVLPAMVHKDRSHYFVPNKENMDSFLKVELVPKKLDALHDRLWLAGLPLPPRPLHRQIMMDRALKLTELPDEHLVWHQTKLLLKPLPDFLLCHEFWVANLCATEELHKSAAGLILSYAWLIERKSDFDIALCSGLIPAGIEWARWIRFIEDFLTHIDLGSLKEVNRRYIYGELRLSRLNHITRFLPSKWSHDSFVRGYISTSTWYQVFFESHFSWLLAVFAFFSMLLSAMQVILATGQLAENRQFAKLSNGIALLAIAVVFFGLALLWFVWGFLFCYHLFSTRVLNKKKAKERRASQSHE